MEVPLPVEEADPVASAVRVGGAEQEAVPVGEDVPVREGEGDEVGDALPVAEEDAEALGVHDGGSERPVLVQPAQGHGAWSPEPRGQKLPTGQMICVGLVEPKGQ